MLNNKNVEEMDDFEFLKEIKKEENQRLSRMLKKNPKAIEKETLEILEEIQSKHPEMVEVVELKDLEEMALN